MPSFTAERRQVQRPLVRTVPEHGWQVDWGRHGMSRGPTSQGWTLQAQEGFTVNPHQLFSLSTLEVSEEAEAILAKALQQHHAGRRFPISGAKSRAPWSETLPRGCLSTPTPVPPYSALSGHSSCPWAFVPEVQT